MDNLTASSALGKYLYHASLSMLLLFQKDPKARESHLKLFLLEKSMMALLSPEGETKLLDHTRSVSSPVSQVSTPGTRGHLALRKSHSSTVESTRASLPSFTQHWRERVLTGDHRHRSPSLSPSRSTLGGSSRPRLDPADASTLKGHQIVLMQLGETICVPGTDKQESKHLTLKQLELKF